ncbi:MULTISPECIES: acetate/propionate family kinase [Pseudanabaena]|jgi:acetate kinase|uniref:acetate/propionate family kinase n=1 Tax=Pseudanabaena TaxID=1152 RepID=UPI002478D52D|nr:MULTISPECIES: acetate kinase [Pseudanabaena]MEA5487043.1 acetate kinase [Pseudanabaena sp. CCNP1317]WGS71746.1 acetate kinase [Pseudanabaena galeata CCNP1313]
MKILVLNAGSSSQKSCLYDLDGALPDIPPEPIWEASIDWTHHEGFAEIKVKPKHGKVLEEEIAATSRSEIITHMLETLWSGEDPVLKSPSEVDIIGHRVVHGGAEYRQSTIINDEVKEAIAKLAIFAPVHNPANLEGIIAAEKVFGNVPQVAVFDTAFHAHLAPAAYTYAIPTKYTEQGIRRYGFHGISHQYCRDRAASILNRKAEDLRLITCHLGNGCSLAAIRNGQSIDTTMGFTPLEGLVMGSRSGSIDAGILIHLLRQPDMDVEKLDRILNRESGLLGISGMSADFRPVLKAIAEGNQQAQLAFDVYMHSLRSHIGSMLASLGGLDVLVFTAGVGENAPLVRERACAGFEFLGLKLDLDKNDQRLMDVDIAMPESLVRVLVIHTQEDWEIARECWHLK